MLQPEIDRVMPELRALAESRMQSRVTIHRETYPDPPETDAAGFTVRSFTMVATDVPFRLASPRSTTGSRTLRVGDSEVEIATQEGHLPTWQSDLADRDLLHVTAGEHVGRWLRVVEASAADQQTARRVPVVEDQKPGVL